MTIRITFYQACSWFSRRSTEYKFKNLLSMNFSNHLSQFQAFDNEVESVQESANLLIFTNTAACISNIIPIKEM